MNILDDNLVIHLHYKLKIENEENHLLYSLGSIHLYFNPKCIWLKKPVGKHNMPRNH